MDNFTGESFDNLVSILNESSSILNDLSNASNTILAFRKQFPPLINWIMSHLSEITDIALYEKEYDSPSIQKFCLTILCYKSPAFGTILSSNRQFLLKMNTFISRVETKTKCGLISFSAIFESQIKNSNGFVIKSFPEKQQLLDKLFNHIDNNSIFSLLYFLTESGQCLVYEFLEDCKFTKKILENTKIHPTKMLLLLTNVVSNIKLDSVILDEILDIKSLDIIFDLAILNKDVHVSHKAFNLLLELCKVCSDIDESYEEDDFPVFEYIIQKADDISCFIQKEPFNLAKHPACELLVGVIPAIEELPQCIYDVAKNLFMRMFLHPYHSILHCSCLKLFEAIAEKDDELFLKIDIREKIVEAFIFEDELNMFKGHLHDFTKLMRKCNSDYENECMGWSNYIREIFQVKETIRNGPFGGKVPKEAVVLPPGTLPIVDI
ncbi:hypothetical protein TRFO_13451 [Tritrichomonas foetus]|uniref:DUF3447 domain-containing protein n=1 Tax=Tritrichomonas foetus TaxID=1144522 RepID=A0A1J4L2K5_9EUKA|nr:hypothetical protein TRFO_13451 [Tritrichomonas foetus]|eukprot:OHT16125.1 hypothetical protein TRFO_13451 [Tritrichomonas foetus]